MTGWQAAYTGINRYADNALLNPDPANQDGILAGCGLVFCFAKRPNHTLNPARFARWTPKRCAFGCRLAKLLWLVVWLRVTIQARPEHAECQTFFFEAYSLGLNCNGINRDRLSYSGSAA